MIGRIKNKLRSQAGASITFALLLFLVCTVLCSVILTAATTASGRMAGIAEADQRYYAVTSAAELLKDVFEEQSIVSVVEVKETTYNTEYTNGSASTPTQNGPVTTNYIVVGRTAAEISEGDIKDDNKVGTIAIDSIQKDVAKSICIPPLPGQPPTSRNYVLSLELNNAPANLNKNVLSVKADVVWDAIGNITMKVYNSNDSKGNASKSGNQYILFLMLGADKSINSSTKTEILSTSYDDENNSYIEKTKATETKITTFTWNLNGIKTSA